MALRCGTTTVRWRRADIRRACRSCAADHADIVGALRTGVAQAWHAIRGNTEREHQRGARVAGLVIRVAEALELGFPALHEHRTVGIGMHADAIGSKGAELGKGGVAGGGGRQQHRSV